MIPRQCIRLLSLRSCHSLVWKHRLDQEEFQSGDNLERGGSLVLWKSLNCYA